MSIHLLLEPENQGGIINVYTTCLVLIAAALSSLAQIALKAGIGASNHNSDRLGFFETLVYATTQPYIWLGALLYLTSMLLWIFVLQKIPVSVAYPMVSLGYVFTTILGYFFFREPLESQKIAGLSVIILGVIILGLSGGQN